MKRLIFTLAFILSVNLPIKASEIIKDITVEGNNRVESTTVKNYLNLNIGDHHSLKKDSDTIKTLYSTLLFNDVKLNFSEGNLRVYVQEPPFISSIEIKGNKKIKNNVITKELLTRKGQPYNSATVFLDLDNIKALYKKNGYSFIDVKIDTISQENNRIKLIFKIVEGKKVKIKYITFVGNNNYNTSELKSVLLTKEFKWYKLLQQNDIYNQDRVEYDKELLKNFYYSVGFLDFKVLSVIAESSSARDYFNLTFSLEEGTQYKFGKINITSKLADINLNSFKKLINIKPGQIFNLKLIEHISKKISDLSAKNGCCKVSVSPEMVKNHNLVDVNLVIDKAEKAFIDQINIEGNFKTEDKVIRRELKLDEGDNFNLKLMEKTEQSLRNLDYFEKVQTNIIPCSNNKYNVNILVQEKSTSSIGFDVGYNSIIGVFGRLSFLEKNLVGTGKYLSAGIHGAKKHMSYYVSITEPYFLGKNLSLGTNVFKNYLGKSNQSEQNYSLESVGVKTSLEYDIIEDLRHELSYLIKREEVDRVDSSSEFFINQLGKYDTSAFGSVFTYDKTDSKIIPKNGYVVSVVQEYAGFGGNNKYLKHEFDAKYFKSFFNNKLTLKVASGAGYITTPKKRILRVSNRFYLGDYSLRGFSLGGVGPRDKYTNDSLGGERYYTLSTEFIFPIGLPEEFDVSGSIFTDIGNLSKVTIKNNNNYNKHKFYDNHSLNASVGFGVLWITKIAPIRIDWALPIKKKPYDNTQKFHIKLSTHF